MPIIFQSLTVMLTWVRVADRGRLPADEPGDDQVVAQAA